MLDAATVPYDQRCRDLAAQVRAFALTTALTRLALGLIVSLPGAIDLNALILLLLLRDLRAGGSSAQRWSLVLVLLELFQIVTEVVVAYAARGWGLSALGERDLTGPTAWIQLMLAVIFATWSVWLCLRLTAVLRAHPTAPPGRGFRYIVALVIVVSALLAPAKVWRERHLVFSDWREERTTVVAMPREGEAGVDHVWERVLIMGPPERERLGLVLLMPVPGDGQAPAIPRELDVLRTTETVITLGHEGGGGAPREVEVGSALWWDPLRGQAHVVGEDLDLAWLEHPDHLAMLLADGLPSRLPDEQPEVEAAP